MGSQGEETVSKEMSSHWGVGGETCAFKKDVTEMRLAGSLRLN